MAEKFKELSAKLSEKFRTLCPRRRRNRQIILLIFILATPMRMRDAAKQRSSHTTVEPSRKAAGVEEAVVAKEETAILRAIGACVKTAEYQFLDGGLRVNFADLYFRIKFDG